MVLQGILRFVGRMKRHEEKTSIGLPSTNTLEFGQFDRSGFYRQQRKIKQDKVQHWFWLGSDQIWKVSEQIVENWTKNVKVFSYGVQICKIIRRKVERQQMVCRKVLQLVLKWFDHLFMNWTKNVNNLNYRVHQMGKKMIKGWDQSAQLLHTCLNNSFYCWGYFVSLKVIRIGRCNTGGFLVFMTAPIKSSSYGGIMFGEVCFLGCCGPCFFTSFEGSFGSFFLPKMEIRFPYLLLGAFLSIPGYFTFLLYRKVAVISKDAVLWHPDIFCGRKAGFWLLSLRKIIRIWLLVTVGCCTLKSLEIA
ncbi:hypothetical protein LXL04_034022 [Taraxacum kok-saghyz]